MKRFEFPPMLFPLVQSHLTFSLVSLVLVKPSVVLLRFIEFVDVSNRKNVKFGLKDPDFFKGWNIYNV